MQAYSVRSSVAILYIGFTFIACITLAFGLVVPRAATNLRGLRGARITQNASPRKPTQIVHQAILDTKPSAATDALDATLRVRAIPVPAILYRKSLELSPSSAQARSTHRPDAFALRVAQHQVVGRQGKNLFASQSTVVAVHGSAQRRMTLAQDQRAFLSLSVNGSDLGQTLAVIRADGVFVRASDLVRAGMRIDGVDAVPIDGLPYVNLTAMPGINVALSEQDLTIKVNAASAYFAGSHIDLSGGLPRGITYTHGTSGFLNYAFDWHNFRQTTEFSELGLSSHGNLYSSGISFANGRAVRGLTSATFDNPSLMKRWVIGDSYAQGGDLGGEAFVGGISVARNFDLNPYFVRYPGVGISGETLTPSSAYVYVNGALIATEQLPPGKFDLSNIPVAAGAGNTQIVIRDAFGRTQTISSHYYFSTTLLARGLSSYSYSLGAIRSNVGGASGDYGPIVFIGSDSVGITNWFTAGARLDQAPGTWSAGPTAAFRLGEGQLGLSGALSHAGGLGGGAAQVNYSFLDKRMSFGGSLETMSAHYATASLTLADDRPLSAASAFAGFEIGPKASATLSYTASNMRDSGVRRNLSLAGDLYLSPVLGLDATVARATATSPAMITQYFVSLNYQLGRNSLAAVSQVGGNGGSGTGISVQQSLPLGEGTGYLIEHGTGSQVRDQDILQYQTSSGLYQASYLNANGSKQEDVIASGGVVDAGDGVMFTRAVEEGFAVIDAGGLSDVRGYFNNQLVGRTDSRGRLLVPNLLSYYGNKLEINDQDIPLNYSVEGTEEIVAPPYRGGSIIRFPIRRIMAVTGQIIIARAARNEIPSFGALRVLADGHLVRSELGRRGEFYLEDLPAGRWWGAVGYAGGSCSLVVVVPHSDAAVADLGHVRCGERTVIGSAP